MQREYSQYWSRSAGADHLMMTFYDYGPCMEYLFSKALLAGVPSPLRNVRCGHAGLPSAVCGCRRAVADGPLPRAVAGTGRSSRARQVHHALRVAQARALEQPRQRGERLGYVAVLPHA